MLVALPCLAAPCHALPGPASPCLAVLRLAEPVHAVPCRAVRCCDIIKIRMFRVVPKHITELPEISYRTCCYLCEMARPKTVADDEPRGKRVTPVVWPSIAEKEFWQAHAKRRGASLAGLIKLLLTEDYETHPPKEPKG